MTHKAGFVNIIGLPNVGKSTLMNALIGERLSIISSKAQTTRHRIFGIYNDEDFQIVFSDTPGFIKDPAYRLQQSMNSFVSATFEDADLFLYVTDRYSPPDSQESLLQKVLKTDTPCLLVINKLDQIQPEEQEFLRKLWQEAVPRAEIFFVSADKKLHTEELFTKIKSFIPEHPAYFPKDEFTDRNMRFIVSEIIREKLLQNYRKEIPYACEVLVEEYKEKEDITAIRALIYTERESQKNIIIGPKGSAIKKVGIEARVAIEEFIGGKVFLELQVKVLDNWRNNELLLKKLGYNQ